MKISLLKEPALLPPSKMTSVTTTILIVIVEGRRIREKFNVLKTARE
jgi:hypothetical protein